jgi:hypothetical protein
VFSDTKNSPWQHTRLASSTKAMSLDCTRPPACPTYGPTIVSAFAKAHANEMWQASAPPVYDVTSDKRPNSCRTTTTRPLTPTSVPVYDPNAAIPRTSYDATSATPYDVNSAGNRYAISSLVRNPCDARETVGAENTRPPRFFAWNACCCS